MNIKPLFFIFLTIACSNVKPLKTAKRIGQKKSRYCHKIYRKTDERHLVMAARIKSSSLTNCFKNYLKFEKNKKQKISICSQLSIKKSGRVSYVQVTDAKRKNLPKDFRMCVMQEYWSMSFKGLQLEQDYLIQFQLNFSSI